MRNQTDFLCEHTAKLGYHLIGLGEWDLNYGLEYLRKKEAQHGFRFLCANLRDSSGMLLFSASDVVEMGGLRIGIISVLDPALKIVTMSADSDEYRMDSPRDALDRELPQLREKTDLIVLLAHLASRETRQLLLDLGTEAGIDFVIEGHDARQYRRINKIEDTYLLAANDQGKYVGQLNILASRDGGVQDATLTVHALDTNSAQVDAIEKLVDEFKKENTKTADIAAPFAHPRTNGSPAGQFLGATNCAQCHSAEFSSYSQTAHARAFNTLIDKGQMNNADCVSCHVVGFYHENGYDRVADPNVFGRESLKNVQCEACHGYGTEHDRSGAWLTEARESCTTCHDSQNSPDFDYDSYWAKIAH
jgi:2',3'-cyclic-nucleotide 2'-phosphodiesterase (5'-nucleotidase family)